MNAIFFENISQIMMLLVFLANLGLMLYIYFRFLKVERKLEDIYVVEEFVGQNQELHEEVGQIKEILENIVENQPYGVNVSEELAESFEPDQLKYRVQHNMDDFYNRLYKKHDNITKNEKMLCGYLRLNLATKEISQITNQSHHAIEMARTRLRKKIGLTKTNISLNSYIGSI